MSTIILNTVLTLSILGIFCVFLLYITEQKFKVDEIPCTCDIASTFAQAIDDIVQDQAIAIESEPSKAGPCIRCARCVTVCPVGLEPYLLMRLSEKQLWQMAEQEHVADCTECGFCQEVCPANRDLLSNIRLGKNKTGIV